MTFPLSKESVGLGKSCLAIVAILWTTVSRSDQPNSNFALSRPDASTKLIGTEAGQVRDDNGVKMKFVWCPDGNFTMGSPESESGRNNGEDQVDVTLTKGFWLGKYEVTQSEWKRVMATDPWKDQKFTKEGDDFPATCVSWNDSMDFCRKLTEQERMAGRLPEGLEYTLPTEAQWERACRARTETKFSFGDDQSKLDEHAWFRDNAWNTDEPYAHRVGQKNANPWGLFDMHGNVWEWCRDVWAEKLPGGLDPEVQRQEKPGGPGTVLRGGGWDRVAASCRCGNRFRNPADFRYDSIGFRVALSSVR
jgi:formylglycine-generating enzyme required for sulfatase activity